MTKEAKPDAWMPLFIGDYKKDTGRLNTEQHGAYLLLIMEYWSTGPLADDDDELSSITLMPPKVWKTNRPKIARFFQIVDGQWRHKRIDEELVKWSERKLMAVERARRAGQASAKSRASSSTPSSTSSTSQVQLMLNSSSSSREVEGLTGHSTLSGQDQFSGPREVRDAFAKHCGEAWTASYIDHCTWQDIPDRALIPATRIAGAKIIREARPVLASMSISVLERAA